MANGAAISGALTDRALAVSAFIRLNTRITVDSEAHEGTIQGAGFQRMPGFPPNRVMTWASSWPTLAAVGAL